MILGRRDRRPQNICYVQMTDIESNITRTVLQFVVFKLKLGNLLAQDFFLDLILIV